MQLHKAERRKAKIKMALQGPSGSGKTYSSLLLAFGLCGKWSKIAVIDTENHSAHLYAHLGEYNVLNIGAPYTPEKYTEAIKLCEKSEMEVIIIDSISHEWEGSGGILDIHGNMAGNSFTNWSRLTPRHNDFIQTILQSPCHIIGTIRSKQDYVLQEKNGKMVPEKVGMKGVTREGMDYEFTMVLDIDIKHHASASKDRTQLFTGKPEFTITEDIGMKISEWCQAGTDEVAALQSSNVVTISQEELLSKIQSCKTYNELLALYKEYPTDDEKLLNAFSTKRTAFQISKPIVQPQNISTNGTITSK